MTTTPDPVAERAEQGEAEARSSTSARWPAAVDQQAQLAPAQLGERRSPDGPGAARPGPPADGPGCLETGRGPGGDRRPGPSVGWPPRSRRAPAPASSCTFPNRSMEATAVTTTAARRGGPSHPGAGPGTDGHGQPWPETRGRWTSRAGRGRHRRPGGRRPGRNVTPVEGRTGHRLPGWRWGRGTSRMTTAASMATADSTPPQAVGHRQQQPVVRSDQPGRPDEPPPRRPSGWPRPADRPHARVDHGQHHPGAEVGCATDQHGSATGDVEGATWWERSITGTGGQAVEDGVDHADELVGRAVVGEEEDRRKRPGRCPNCLERSVAAATASMNADRTALNSRSATRPPWSLRAR